MSRLIKNARMHVDYWTCICVDVLWVRAATFAELLFPRRISSRVFAVRAFCFATLARPAPCPKKTNVHEMGTKTSGRPLSN